MTQTDMVLQYMREFGSITPLDAVRELGCLRLAARIADLKAMGYEVKTVRESAPNRWGRQVPFARYSLAKEV